MQHACQVCDAALFQFHLPKSHAFAVSVEAQPLFVHISSIARLQQQVLCFCADVCHRRLLHTLFYI